MKRSLDENLIRYISSKKNEPEFMLDFRLKCFEKFLSMDNPNFGPELNIFFDKINYYNSKSDSTYDDWNNVDKDIKNTFDDLGVIDAEDKYLDGVSNQFESEVIYHKNINKDVIFTSTDDALKKYPLLFKKYFNKLVKYDENKFTALNGALWSGGSFIYVPKNVTVDRPLQSYFRIDSESLGQFERTIIIVDDNAHLEYIEGCSAKSYSSTSLHAGVVEIFVGKNASCRYSTIQNWSKDVYNLVTKRAIVDESGKMEWIDGNIGSCVTMKYPSCILKGNNSEGKSLSIAYAKNNQHLDAGAKMIHLGENTSSTIISKSIAESSGKADYRGKVVISKDAINSKSFVKCDTLILDDKSKSDTYPSNVLNNESSYIEHEATVSKINEEKLKYLMSKGLSEDTSKELIITGFISDFKKELPMEYAIEINRLLKD